MPKYKITATMDVGYSAEIEAESEEEAWEIACNDDFDHDTLDLPTKCKLITAIVRNNRFCDGVLVSAFESGLILRILKSIEKQIPPLCSGGISKKNPKV